MTQQFWPGIPGKLKKIPDREIPVIAMYFIVNNESNMRLLKWMILKLYI